MSRRILVLNGPNLNLLGSREPTVYGRTSLDTIVAGLQQHASDRGIQLRHHQANGEGELIDVLHEAREWAAGVVLNPAAYSHTSVALRDAVAAIDLPVVEIHLSNTAAREEFRHRSLLTAVCIGVVAGFGADGYRLALDGLLHHLDQLTP